MRIVTNHLANGDLGVQLGLFSKPPVKARIAVAYFVSHEFIERLSADQGSSVHLVVSLTPPTNFYALQRIFWLANVRVDVILNGFHSKVYVLESAGGRIASVGSSNLTTGGMFNNIESNVLIEGDEIDEFEVPSHFEFISSRAMRLTPTMLDAYKAQYDLYRAQAGRESATGLTAPVAMLSKQARSFVGFWSIVYYVRQLVLDIALAKFPGIEAYIAVDHFWHFVVSVKKSQAVKMSLLSMGRDEAIRSLFAEFAEWDINGEQYCQAIQTRSLAFQRLLHPDVIDSLNEAEIIEVYACLHSNSMPMQRFRRHLDFVKDNSAEDIRRTWRQLLHGAEPIERRIDRALTSDRLRHFGPSNVQEMNGWYRPSEFPIRNSLADEAMSVLEIGGVL